MSVCCVPECGEDFHCISEKKIIFYLNTVENKTVAILKVLTQLCLCLRVCVQVGETSVVNVDCSRAGPGELSLEAALDSPPASPVSSKPGRSGKSQFFPSCSIASVSS